MLGGLDVARGSEVFQACSRVLAKCHINFFNFLNSDFKAFEIISNVKETKNGLL